MSPFSKIEMSPFVILNFYLQVRKGGRDMGDVITMSKKELTRAELMQRPLDKRLNQAEAARLLNVSVRHVKRLLRSYRKSGSAGLVSKRRGKPGNHHLPDKIKDQALKLILATYPDFGPTLAHEKLVEVHNLKLSVESVRKLMISAQLWKPKPARAARIHQMRERRSCLGELCQIDGSPHDWFEGRAPRCSLLVFIDDATGRLLLLRFVNSESTFSYFDAVDLYLRQHGKPKAFYSDKFSVFRAVQSQALKGDAITQFGRAMQDLDIEIICANTPQAKGRVERVNQTLQDRLVKEMRLRAISSIEEANLFLPEFIQDFNARFAVVAKSKTDAHRPLVKGEKLGKILRVKESWVLSKNLQLSYDRVIYQIQSKRPRYALRYQRVWVCHNSRGEVEIEYKGKALDYKVYHKQQRQAEVADSKQVEASASSHKPLKKMVNRYVPRAGQKWGNFRLRGSRPPKPVEGALLSE
jgi:hypothetical protein